MDGAFLKKGMCAEGSKIRGDLFCRDHFRTEEEMQLVGATVGGNAEFADSNLKGGIDANGLRLGRDLYFRDVVPLGNIQLLSANILGDIQIRDGEVTGEIDLTGAHIRGELHLGNGKAGSPNWTQGAALILRNAKLGALAGSIESFQIKQKQATSELYPQLDFVGLRYHHLGGMFSRQSESLENASAAQLDQLLNQASITGERFVPGPYLQLARVLEAGGQKTKSAELRFRMRHQEWLRSSTKPRMRPSFSKHFTGYGYHPWKGLIWLLAFAVAWTFLGLALNGELAFRFPNLADLERTTRWFWFSLGNSLPLISLDEAHKTFLSQEVTKNTALITSLFHFHKLAGYALVTYLVASLAGVVDKRD